LNIAYHYCQWEEILATKRTNYKQEKRTKELDKQKKKEAKQERKMNKEKSSPEDQGFGQEENS
jgi:hypothetical protein